MFCAFAVAVADVDMDMDMDVDVDVQHRWPLIPSTPPGGWTETNRHLKRANGNTLSPCAVGASNVVPCQYASSAPICSNTIQLTRPH